MANDQASGNQPQAEGQQEQQIQLRDPGVHAEYANFFTIVGGEDAVLLSFGNIFGGQNVVQLESKVVLSPRNTKRLAMSLGSVIRRYEEQHGEIDVGTPGQAQKGPAAGPPQGS